jgi:hypothetical protein
LGDHRISEELLQTLERLMGNIIEVGKVYSSCLHPVLEYVETDYSGLMKYECRDCVESVWVAKTDFAVRYYKPPGLELT